MWRDNMQLYPQYVKSLFLVRRFLALLQTAKVWFTRLFRILFDCRISSIWAIDSWVYSSFFYSSSSTSCSAISFTLCSMLEIKGIHWVCNKQKWNVLAGAKRVLPSRGATNSFTFFTPSFPTSPYLKSKLNISRKPLRKKTTVRLVRWGVRIRVYWT